MSDRRRKRNGIGLLLAPLTVAVCLLVIYALRGIYPFGTLSVAQGDLEQQYCAMYTQLYDVLRGEASPLFSWLTALSRGQSMDMMIFGCFSPLNLMFLLVPRDALLANMSYYVLIKLSLCALTMAWYVQKRFPSLSPLWGVFFGVAYGLSGHALLHFHNTLWLEAMILLPVYLYYAEKMLTGGRVLPYTLLLACLLVINFYPAAMVCVFTFFAGGAYIVLRIPRESRGKAALRIAAGTLLAFALSAFRTVPAGLQLVRAARLGYAGAGLFSPFTGYSWLRGFALSTSCFALVLLPWRIHALLRAGERRKAAFIGITLLTLLLPLFFDGIDTLWHFGGNIGFAYRYGFLTVFVVLAFSAEALTHWQAGAQAAGGAKWARVMQYFVTAGVLLCYCYIALRDGRRATDFIDWNRALMVVLTLAAAASYLAALLLPSRRVQRVLCLAVLLVQACCYGYSAFLAEDTVALPEASSTEASALAAAFSETDDISRVKVEDASLTINYPKYMGRPALSGFSSSTTQTTLDMARALGYGISAYAVQDCGGTLFSDALLHVTSTVSLSDRFIGDSAYALSTKVGRYYVYDNVYTLPFGITGDASVCDIALQQHDCFSLQNALYASLSGDAEPLLTVPDTTGFGGDAAFTPVPEGEAARYLALVPVDGYGEPVTGFICITLPVAGTKRVYLYDGGVNPGAKLSAVVEREGAVVRVTDMHPITYFDGVYDLGAYTDETITIVVAGEAERMCADVRVALLDMEKLAAFTAAKSENPAVTDVVTGKRSLSLCVTAQADGETLLLPVQYSENWRAHIDGRRVAASRVAGDLMGFTLEQGAHSLTMTYWPAGLTAGIVCSALAALAAVWLFLRERGEKPLFAGAPPRISAAVEKLLTAAWLAALLVCYVLPVAFAMALWYKNLH